MGAQVLVLIDGSDSSVAGPGDQCSTPSISTNRCGAFSGPRTMAVEMRPKMLFNPDSRSANFFLPG
jgi:ABC-2 type transport system permease protein